MRTSTLALTLTGLLSSLVQAAPAPGVVIVTAYTTVIVDESGLTITPSAQTENAQAEYTRVPAVQIQSSSKDDEPTLAIASTLSNQEQSLQPTTSTATSTSSTEFTPLPVSTSPTSSSSSSTSSTSSTSSSQATGSLQSGEGTYYSTGLGSCGITSSDTDYIIAVSHEMYDQYTPNGNPNKNTLCGKKVRAFYGDNSVDVTVVDRCEACSYNDLDFSPSAFSQLASQSLGRIDITWEWLD